MWGSLKPFRSWVYKKTMYTPRRNIPTTPYNLRHPWWDMFFTFQSSPQEHWGGAALWWLRSRRIWGIFFFHIQLPSSNQIEFAGRALWGQECFLHNPKKSLNFSPSLNTTVINVELLSIFDNSVVSQICLASMKWDQGPYMASPKKLQKKKTVRIK